MHGCNFSAAAAGADLAGRAERRESGDIEVQVQGDRQHHEPVPRLLARFHGDGVRRGGGRAAAAIRSPSAASAGAGTGGLVVYVYPTFICRF